MGSFSPWQGNLVARLCAIPCFPGHDGNPSFPDRKPSAFHPVFPEENYLDMAESSELLIFARKVNRNLCARDVT